MTEKRINLVLITLCFFLVIFTTSVEGDQSILSFGAIPNNSSISATQQNTLAIAQAFYAANASETDRVVSIPADLAFYIFNVVVNNVVNITVHFDGILVMSNNISYWPTANGGGGSLAALYLGNSHYVNFTSPTGLGLFDGQGYDWWWYVWITGTDNRPNMVWMQQCTDIVIEKIKFQNSPMYHLYLNDMKDVLVRKINIFVDVEKQLEIYRKFDALDEFGIPTFPLNTDGIDPSGINIIIEDSTILNYDDTVAVKPMNGNGMYSTCSSEIIVRNMEITMGVGMSIGSVPPNTAVNCVRNVLFHNITFHHAIKAIYIKTNPGDEGSGIIDNITYQNITSKGNLWYPIWIGPQQEHQPHQQGKGCNFFYPIFPHCNTQPLVPITNIYIINVTMERGLFLPGVVLCNETNPCSNIQFINVVNRGEFIVQNDYVCENVLNFVSTNSSPSLVCNSSPDYSTFHPMNNNYNINNNNIISINNDDNNDHLRKINVNN